MSLPRMSWHIGDYKKDTGHLRAAHHGAYFMLCMHYWATGGLPDDDKQLATIACMTDREWKACRTVIEPLFKGEGKWKHKRIELELADAQAKYERRAEAGSKGGNAKAAAKQCSSNATSIGEAIAKQPITDNLKKDAEPDGSHSNDEADLFRRGTQVLGKGSGGLVVKLLKSKNGAVPLARAAVEQASTKHNPREYIGRVIAGPAGHVMANGELAPEGIT